MDYLAYIQKQNERVDAYVKGVTDGSIICNRWIKLAVKRYKADLKRSDLVLKQEKVDHVFHFFSMLNIGIKNKSQQFDLFDYQAFIIKNLFLFYYLNGKRRYRYSFVFISRKSGKTVFAMALELYFLIGDGVMDPECLLLASTREQATIALNYGKGIVMRSPAISRIVEIQRYQLLLKTTKTMGFIKTLASNADHLDGYSPNSAILDEIHSYSDDSLLNVMKSGILVRENPMILLISTAGFLIDSFCNEMVVMCKSILKGNITDDSFFCMLFTLDDKDEWDDPANWIKSNPSIGKTISMDDLKIEYNQAINMPSQLANFKTKNLNVFTESTNRWIDEEALLTAYRDIDIDLSGARCYIGADLSSTKDLSCLALLFEKDGKFYSKYEYLLPLNQQKKIRRGGVDLTNWVNQKWIIESQTKTLDYDLLFQIIENLSKQYNIVSFMYDPFNSALIVPKVEELSINCFPVRQTAMNFNFPLKFLEKQLYDENLILGKNPVVRWNFRNVVLYTDGNGNIKIMKNKSLDSVDGVVSLGMAFAGWIAENLDMEKLGLEMYLKNP